MEFWQMVGFGHYINFAHFQNLICELLKFLRKRAILKIYKVLKLFRNLQKIFSILCNFSKFKVLENLL